MFEYFTANVTLKMGLYIFDILVTIYGLCSTWDYNYNLILKWIKNLLEKQKLKSENKASWLTLSWKQKR